MITLMSIIVSSIISFVIGRYFYNKKGGLYKKKEQLTSSFEYLKNIRAEPIELIRHGFSNLFLILLLISVNLFVPSFFGFLEYKVDLIFSDGFINVVRFWVGLSCIFVSYFLYRNFNDVVHYKKAIVRYQKKLNKLNEKIDHS